MKKFFIIFTIFLAIKIYSQDKIDLIGNFEYSVSWYYHFELKLLEDNRFETNISSDIGGSKTIGIWSQHEDILTLIPSKYYRYYRSDGEWKERIDSTGNFSFDKIKILSRDELFFESKESHMHINRSPTSKDGPFKLIFPSNTFEITEISDSIILVGIIDYLNDWDFQHGFDIELTPVSSAKDRYFDDYIGLKRSRSLVEYFSNEGVGSKSIIIRDDLKVLYHQGESYVEIRIIHNY